jgi:hypothetical protein
LYSTAGILPKCKLLLHLYGTAQSLAILYFSTLSHARCKVAVHASYEVKEVYFDAKWNEGSEIESGKRGGVTKTTTRTVTLDSLAHYPHHHHHANVNNNGSVSDIIEQHQEKMHSILCKKAVLSKRMVGMVHTQQFKRDVR